MTEADRLVATEERFAIQHELELATRQVIPQEAMIAGLLAVAWPRCGSRR